MENIVMTQTATYEITTKANDNGKYSVLVSITNHLAGNKRTETILKSKGNVVYFNNLENAIDTATDLVSGL